MSLLHAVILGIVQGITEFLPVSSSGHLALFHAAFDYAGDESAAELLFDVVLHMGTLVSVFIVLRKEIWALIRKPFQKTTALLIMATVPIIPAALLFRDNIDALRTNMPFLMVGFVITALLLFYADRVNKTHLTKEIKDVRLTDALVVGIMQAVAICPAISRSGSTTAASLFRKMKREDAAKFVFLLSIPSILGAAVMEGRGVITGAIELSAGDMINMAFGFFAAVLSGYLAVNLVFKLIQQAKLRYFSFYLFALAAFVGVDTFLLNGMFFGR
ncbi:MAG: undecaprenyl-diphosphate phosphatase [Defluviitaleaceae bacterium]|nr:undecaprenyl-diphosphate phosphatase [Defluviitaleaceae bacterium]MCL2835580.1 undecaprenyl-diphosphate phosphatase [Defluviitaleaceae bacterium]